MFGNADTAQIARELLGEPNAALSSSKELRFGTHGSVSVDLEKGVWFDHEANEGGGVHDLVQRETGLANGAVQEWLCDRGFTSADSTRSRWEDRIEARYPYHDEAGTLLFEVVRLRAPKEFRQRAADGTWKTKGIRKPLYRLPELIAAPEDAVVFVVEGEKDADRLCRLGLVATTCPGGANKWRSEHSKTLSGRRVAILPDNDAEGARHASNVRDSIRAMGGKAVIVELEGLPEKGDVSDWLDAGGTAERLTGLAETALSDAAKPSVPLRTAAELQRMTIPEPSWLVEDMLPEGLTLFAGKPKIGKSWAALDLAYAVASGGRFLARGCARGSVLYLAMEDNDRRLQARLRCLAPGERWPDQLIFATEWPRLDEGGLEQIEQWLDAEPDARLVVVDTFQCVRPPQKSSEGVYGSDYAALRGLHAIAATRGVAVVVIHHLRKTDAADPFDTVSGSTGLTGAADTALILKGEDGEVTLYGRGRDIEEFERAVEFENHRWHDLGDPSEAHTPDTRAAILEALRAGHHTPKKVAEFTGEHLELVKKTMQRMYKAGDILRPKRGHYTLRRDPGQTVSPVSPCPAGAKSDVKTEACERDTVGDTDGAVPFAEPAAGDTPGTCPRAVPFGNPLNRNDDLGCGDKGTKTPPLSPDEIDAFEERAAILEHDGELPRAEAEAAALAEVLERRTDDPARS